VTALSWNFTKPVIIAKSVSSLPCRHFPGLVFGAALPHQDRAGVDQLPAERLTPSLCPCESRPFVEEPPPFLLAMT